MCESDIALPVEHLPRGEDFLMWPPCLQSYGYRIVDRLFATRPIRCGSRVRELPRGRALRPAFRAADGEACTVDRFMDRNSIAGLLVLRHGEIVLERYGLALRPEDRWSTMSTVKSMTAMLAGAAVHDGAIRDIDDDVARYLPQLAGSAYEGVSIRHLLTMSSGVQWTEDYTDRQSDVNRYSKSLADKVPGGVLRMLRELPREFPPGCVWRYNTGDTYLLGAVIAAATGRTLADYMSEKIWRPFGMEFEGYYTLESDGGQEIGGSRAGMALRDIGRFALFVLEDGVAGGRRVLPEGWIDAAARRAFDVPASFGAAHRRALGITGYGFSWWLREDGAMLAMGHSGQRIFVDRPRALAVVSLAAYPEPRYAGAAEHDRDAELAGLIESIRAMG